MPTLDELERTHILSVLELCEGQKTKAAAMLGINRTTLWKKLRQYGIEATERPGDQSRSWLAARVNPTQLSGFDSRAISSFTARRRAARPVR